MNILVVCKGNQARSPLVEALLVRSLGAESVRSRGWSQEAGRGAEVLSKIREYARAAQLSLGNHVSRRLSKEDIEWADLVVYMDRADKRALREIKCKKKMVCLAKYVDKEEIPDPVNIPRGFELGAVCKLIKKAAIGLILSFTPKEERNGSTPTD